MTIKNGTTLWKRVDPEIDGNYTQSFYCSNEIAYQLQIGHHKPTIEQLNGIGWMTRKHVDYSPATHKPDGDTDNGLVVTKKITELTSAEIDEYEENVAANEFRQASKALLLATEASDELAYWVEKESAGVTQIINDAPNTFASFKQMIDKNAQAILVMAKLFKYLRDSGKFD